MASSPPPTSPLDVLAQLKEYTPSARAGLPWQIEERFRFLGANLIQLAGMLLGMPQAVVLTGQHLFHQLYLRHSFLELSVLDGAMASLFVAGKVEECYRRARDMVNVFRWVYGRVRSGRGPEALPYICDEYYGWRERLTTAEMHLLRAVGFHVQPEQRTSVMLLLSILRALNLSGCAIGEASLALLNDAFRSIAVLVFDPATLACTALELASKQEDFTNILPSDVSWWNVLGVSGAHEQLEACADLMRAVKEIKYDTDLPLVPSELQVYAEAFEGARAGPRRDCSESPRSRRSRRSRSHNRSRSRTRSLERSRSRHRHYSSRRRDHRY